MFKKLYDYEDFAQSTTNEDGSRVYVNASGVAYPSATTVLSVLSKDSIKEWRKRVGEEEANRISSTAATRGTKIHTLVEKYLDNEEITEELYEDLKVDPFNKQLFEDYKKFLNCIDNIHAQELALYSDHLRMAGRVDCIAEYNGKLSVIDYKTSRKLKRKEWIESYFMQATAYSIMYEERTGIPIPQIVIGIAVDHESEPQVFVEKRDNWTKKLLNTRDYFETGRYF